MSKTRYATKKETNKLMTHVEIPAQALSDYIDELEKDYDDGTRRAVQALSDYIDAEVVRRVISESSESQPDGAESAPVTYGLRPTPISIAVHAYLASLPRRPYDGESMLDSDQLQGCIRNPQLRKLLVDVIEEQGLSSIQSDELLRHRAASSLRLAAKRLARGMLSRSSSTQTLLSRLQQDTDTV